MKTRPLQNLYLTQSSDICRKISRRDFVSPRDESIEKKGFFNALKIIFLDRDGVINRDPNGYVMSWKGFHFLPKVKKSIRILNKNGFSLIVISNQGGIAKGLFTKEALNDITKKMLLAVSKSGGKISSAWYCPHKLEDNCSCKKPKTGLFKMATKGIKFNKKDSFFIGDSEVDIKAGKRFGIGTIMVFSGKTKRKDLKKIKVKPDYMADSLLDATKIILKRALKKS